MDEAEILSIQQAERSYLDFGFDSFMIKPVSIEAGGEMSVDDANVFLSGFSGGLISKDSISGDKIIDKTLTNKDIADSNKIYEAIVSQEANADFGNIQSAIDAVNGLGGGTVFVKSGTYVLLNDLVLYSNISLIGVDSDTCIIDFNGTQKSLRVGNATGPITLDNVSIKNIHFTGRVQTTSPVTLGAIDATCNNFIIEGCKFTDNWNAINNIGADIALNNGKLITITMNNFDDSGISISTGGSLDPQITFNVFNASKEATSHNIVLGGGTGPRVMNNVFTDNAGKGIISGTADDVFGTIITGNRFDNQGVSAMELGVSVTVEESIISNNTINGSGADALLLGANFGRNVIVGNIISATTGDGIDINGGGKNIIASNHIVNASVWGIDLDASTANNLVHGNILESNTSGGITNAGSNTLADNLTF